MYHFYLFLNLMGILLHDMLRLCEPSSNTSYSQGMHAMKGTCGKFFSNQAGNFRVPNILINEQSCLPNILPDQHCCPDSSKYQKHMLYVLATAASLQSETSTHEQCQYAWASCCSNVEAVNDASVGQEIKCVEIAVYHMYACVNAYTLVP